MGGPSLCPGAPRPRLEGPGGLQDWSEAARHLGSRPLGSPQPLLHAASPQPATASLRRRRGLDRSPPASAAAAAGPSVASSLPPQPQPPQSPDSKSPSAAAACPAGRPVSSGRADGALAPAGLPASRAGNKGQGERAAGGCLLKGQRQGSGSAARGGGWLLAGAGSPAGTTPR